MKKHFMILTCILAFICYLSAAENNTRIELVTDMPEGFTELSVIASPDTPASVVIQNPDGTIFAEWSNQIADASNSDISSECIEVDLRKIMDLDFLTDIEINELIQKYIDRKHNTSSIQIDVKDMRK